MRRKRKRRRKERRNVLEGRSKKRQRREEGSQSVRVEEKGGERKELLEIPMTKGKGGSCAEFVLTAVKAVKIEELFFGLTGRARHLVVMLAYEGKWKEMEDQLCAGKVEA